MRKMLEARNREFGFLEDVELLWKQVIRKHVLVRGRRWYPWLHEMVYRRKTIEFV